VNILELGNYIQLEKIKLKQDKHGKTVNIKSKFTVPSPSKRWHQHWHIRNHYVPILFGEITLFMAPFKIKNKKNFCDLKGTKEIVCRSYLFQL
jgi:hypothetical protein